MLRVAPAVLALLALVAAPPASAQIATDGTVGEAVELGGPDFAIPATLGAQRGDNLFHSFERFGVPQGGSATFTGEGSGGGIDNVIGRVTGGGVSEILGPLRSTIPGANLFLLNPAGLVFGPESSLDIGGSFFATSAGAVELGRGGVGGVFSAIDPAADQLSSVDPAGFSFRDAPLGQIRVEGRLEVAPGERIALIGGAPSAEEPGVTISGAGLGFVSAPEGEVLVVSVASPGTVRGAAAARLAPDVSDFAALGSVDVVDDAIVSVSGLSPATRLTGLSSAELLARWGETRFAGGPDAVFLGTLPSGAPLWFHPFVRPEGAGTLAVRAHDLRVVDSDLRAITPGNGAAGLVDVELAGDLELDRIARDVSTGLLARAGGLRVSGTIVRNTVQGPVQFALDAPLPSRGDGGDLVVSAENVSLTGGAVIANGTAGRGRGGDVRVVARGDVDIRGRSGDQVSAIFSNAQGPGDTGHGGRIELDARSLRLSDGGAVIAQTTGNSDAGDIDVRVATLEVADDGQIDNSTSAQLLADDDPGTTRGEGGSISVTATESIRLSGRLGERDFARLSTFSQEKSTGRAGRITVRTPQLVLENGGGIAVTSRGAGEAGAIDAFADRVTLQSGAELSSRSTGEAPGPSGTAGGIAIAGYSGPLAERVEIFGGSTVTAAAPRSDGGNVDIRAGELVHLRDSEISASVGGGQGGNVTIDPRFVVLDSSRIIATATTGAGGNIAITAERFFPSGDSVVSASSQLGVDGSVEIRSPDVDLSGGLARLPSSLLDAGALLRERCAVRAAEAGSSLVVEARDGMPATPHQPTTARYAIRASDGGPERAAAAQALERAQRLEARGLYSASLASLVPVADWAQAWGSGDERASFHALRARVRERAGLRAAAGRDREQARELARTEELRAALSLDEAAALVRGGEGEAARVRYAELAGELRASGPDRVRGQVAVERAHLALDARDLASARQALARIDALPTLPDVRRALAVARLAELEGPASPARLAAARLYAEAARAGEGRGDLAGAAWAWGELGALYERDGRRADALKLTRRALLAAQRARAPESLYRWQWQAGRLHAAAGDEDRALAEYRAAAATLAGLRQLALVRDARAEAVERELAAGPLTTELIDLLLRRARAAAAKEQTALLREALERIEDLSAADLQDYFHDFCVTAQRRALPEGVPGALVVYPVVLPDRLELIVGSGSELVQLAVPVPEADFRREARALRRRLQERTTRRYRPHAEQLYDWLVRPLEGELERRQPEVLVFVPRGQLLGVPMAALYDRERSQFLVEQHPLAVAPGLSLTDPRPFEGEGARVLKAGLTRAVQGFPPLPYVAEEMAAVSGLFAGPTLLDESFAADSLTRELGSQPFGVVHLASHAAFGEDVDDGFVLTYDGRLGMDHLGDLVRTTAFRDQPLELLTLSACQTAVGTDRSALGLAGVAVKSGARSTLGTLWFVNDQASAELVAAFYESLAAPGVSRAAALQRAQVAAIGNRALRHPGYWSGFVLIGSWL